MTDTQPKSTPATSTPIAPPCLPDAAHKGQAGRILCLCGSTEMPGAAVLSVRAAQRAGAGLVTLAVFAKELIQMVSAHSPETLYLDLSRTQDLFAGRLPRAFAEAPTNARLMGPGMGASGRTRELVRRVVEDEFEGPLVLDADALNVLAGAPEVVQASKSQLILTPHPGEAARLLERQIPGDDDGRIEVARELAESSGAICVLKGRHSVVTDGSSVYLNRTGGPAMATAGTGDVLAGITASYAGRSARMTADGECPADFDLFGAVCAAVHVHGRAGDLAAAKLGQAGVVASDLIDCLPQAQLEHALRCAGSEGPDC